MRFRLVTKSVTLNGVIAVILLYFTEFGNFWRPLRKGGYTPMLSGTAQRI